MTYIASHEEQLQAFCTLTGFGQKDLAQNLPDPAFQGFLLDFALNDESLLLAFCADTGVQPQDVVRARQSLPGYSA